jgi:hypothetical protein
MNKNDPTSRTRLSRLAAILLPVTVMRAARDVGFMFFLLRMAFWLGLVLMLLPSGSGQRSALPHGIGAAGAISAASAAVHDLRGFCAREPNACTIGSELAADMGGRARAAARMLYDLLIGALTRHLGSSSDREGQSERGRAAPPSENTLTPTDLAPTWRGRPPHGGAAHSA